MVPESLDLAQFGPLVISVVVALSGFFGAVILLFKYSKTLGRALERYFHAGCRNDSTLCVILGNSIVHRCEIATQKKCLPQEERDWLIKLMTEYSCNRHWNGVVQDRYEKAILLPLTSDESDE